MVRQTTLAGLALAALISVSASASADVPPPDVCDKEGESCNNAGSGFNESGTCTASKCTRVTPSPDGGTATVEYDCLRCMAGGGGTGGGGGGKGGSGGGQSGSAGKGSTDDSSSNDDGSCALTPSQARDTGLVGAMILIGLAALGFSRRRRS